MLIKKEYDKLEHGQERQGTCLESVTSRVQTPIPSKKEQKQTNDDITKFSTLFRRPHPGTLRWFAMLSGCLHSQPGLPSPPSHQPCLPMSPTLTGFAKFFSLPRWPCVHPPFSVWPALPPSHSTQTVLLQGSRSWLELECSPKGLVVKAWSPYRDVVEPLRGGAYVCGRWIQR
jgi:hypothetical protein